MAKPKPIIGLDCDGPALAGIALGLSIRMEEMYAFRHQALDSRDPEGVHNMRVASRRLRSALVDFMPYLGKARLRNSLRDIEALARVLGRVRDCDVAIITLKKVQSKAPSDISVGIRRFANIHHAAREEAWVKLVHALEPIGLSRLRSTFVETLDRVIMAARRGKNTRKSLAAARLTYREVSRSTILDRLKDLEERSDGLYHPLRIKPLHKMRIAAKHLRYTLELFDQCRELQVTFFAKRLAGMQSSLGKLHDCDVWIKYLGDAARSELPNPSFDLKATIVWLLINFTTLRAKHLRDTLKQWDEWESNQYGKRLRMLFESSPARQPRELRDSSLL